MYQIQHHIYHGDLRNPHAANAGLLHPHEHSFVERKFGVAAPGADPRNRDALMFAPEWAPGPH